MIIVIDEIILTPGQPGGKLVFRSFRLNNSALIARRPMMISGARPTVRIGASLREADRKDRAASCVRGPTAGSRGQFACEVDGKDRVVSLRGRPVARIAPLVRRETETLRIAGLVCVVDTRERTHAQTRAPTHRTGR